MKTAIKMLLGLAIVLGAVVVAQAQDDKKDDKEKTLKGELGCPKCVFKVKGQKKCANAIKVKEGAKFTIYIFEDKGSGESYHRAICTETKKGSVTGKVSKKGDQMMIKPKEDGVKFD